MLLSDIGAELIVATGDIEEVLGVVDVLPGIVESGNAETGGSRVRAVNDDSAVQPSSPLRL